MYFLFLILNIFLYLLFLKIFLVIFGNKYIFPVRIAELLNLVLNIFFNLALAFYFFDNLIFINIIFINLCLFFISYSVCSMISTSPRTKILLDLYKFKKINEKIYLKKYYNEKIILINRINRLLTNNEIIYTRTKSIVINNKGFKFFSVVAFFFNLMKKL